jgi:hypothetical protein
MNVAFVALSVPHPAQNAAENTIRKANNFFMDTSSPIRSS